MSIESVFDSQQLPIMKRAKIAGKTLCAAIIRSYGSAPDHRVIGDHRYVTMSFKRGDLIHIHSDGRIMAFIWQDPA